MNTLEYNKRCAEFLGAVNIGQTGQLKEDSYTHELFKRDEWCNRFQDNIEKDDYTPFSMKFDSDWNWIMEVVEAIENNVKYSNIVQIWRNYCSIDVQNSKYKDVFDVRSIESTKKEATIQAIDKFLIWYNENK